MATSVPVPMAMPMSAWASAGASLMPSPTMATILPAACSSLTAWALRSGRTSASTWLMPTWRAMASAVRRLSPVIMYTSSPRASRDRTAAAESGLRTSATPMIPATAPSVTTNMGVLPSSRKPVRGVLEAVQRIAALVEEPAIAEQDVDPARRSPPHPGRGWPRNGRRRRVAAAGSSPPRRWLRPAGAPSLARRTRPGATTRSRSAPALRRPGAGAPTAKTMSVTSGLPRVSVPVLSSTMTSSL